MHYFDLKPGIKHRLTLDSVTPPLQAVIICRRTVEAMYDGRYQARSKGCGLSEEIAACWMPNARCRTTARQAVIHSSPEITN